MSEAFNTISRLLTSLDKKDEAKTKQKKKLKKPPSNWSNYGIIKYLKENPELIGDAAFETPLLEEFYECAKYVSEVRKTPWPEFESRYVVPVNERLGYYWGLEKLFIYFQEAYSENKHSEAIDKSIDKKIRKFNKIIEMCGRRQKWFASLFGDDRTHRVVNEFAKVVAYLKVTKDDARLIAATDAYAAAWDLINTKLEQSSLTKEQYNARIASRYEDTDAPEHKEAKRYNETLKASFRFANYLDDIFFIYNVRLAENVVRYLKAAVKFLSKDTDSASYIDSATENLAKYLNKTVSALPPEIEKGYAEEPRLWPEYACISLTLDHKINDSTLNSMAVYTAELVKEASKDEIGWQTARNILSRAANFFKYIAKYNKRYAVIEHAFLQKENVTAATEYVNAFKRTS